jgi:NAD(P)-dependent dehydrogenase (short-subunit alcohol dehydrogenase family)
MEMTIVTGATGAMGAAAVEALAAEGRAVLMACRNRAKAEAVRSGILARIPDARLEIRELDLASLASVRAFAEGIEPGTMTALFNNAGVISRGYGLTEDGLENSFAVNYFGPWLLTRMLAEKMPDGSRIVNMVSLTCRFVRITPDSLRPAPKDFSQLGTYARSKRALLSFSQELSRRHPGLRVNVADPGIVASDMIDLGHWYDPLADALFKPFCKSPAAGVRPALSALSSDTTGHYFVGRTHRPIPRRYHTPTLDQALWDATEREMGYSIGTQMPDS